MIHHFFGDAGQQGTGRARTFARQDHHAQIMQGFQIVVLIAQGDAAMGIHPHMQRHQLTVILADIAIDPTQDHQQGIVHIVDAGAGFLGHQGFGQQRVQAGFGAQPIGHF